MLSLTDQPLTAGQVAIVTPSQGRSSTEAAYLPRRSPVSPSLRLRASAANRSLLRWMRAAEQSAWLDADSPRRALRFFAE